MLLALHPSTNAMLCIFYAILVTCPRLIHWTQRHHSHKQISSLHFMFFTPFSCCLGVVLSLDKGACPENLRVV